MAGPALADLLFGMASPTGRLPATFPRVSGQVPIYYGRRNTGRPAYCRPFVHMDDLPVHAQQHSSGHACFHLDAGYTPLFPFGFGLSYTEFEYRDIRVEPAVVPMGSRFRVEATVRNVGNRPGEDVAQLYLRDLVGSVTRPVRELKGIRRSELQPGEERRIVFELHTDDLAFHGRDCRWATEPGCFHAWIGSDSTADLKAVFEVVDV